MSNFPTGTETPFARAVSAEIRAVLAARRLTLRELATGSGFKSHNYVAIRLRDEKPFNLDDIERIVAFLEGDSTEAWQFIKRADEAHSERLWIEAQDAGAHLELSGSAAPQGQGARAHLELSGGVSHRDIKPANLVTTIADEDHVSLANLARVMGDLANVADPNERVTLFIVGMGAVGSAQIQSIQAEEEATFTEDDWDQLEELANSSIGQPVKEFAAELTAWVIDRWATFNAGDVLLIPDADQNLTSIPIKKGTTKESVIAEIEAKHGPGRRKPHPSSFEEPEAARDEDREKPRID